MTGTILQINVSRGGLPKRPIPEGRLTPLGLEGDAHDNPAIHGGPEKAVLIVCSEVVDELAARGYPVFYGALGENLTVSGLDPRQLRAGQRYRAGSALIELTKVRAPCVNLDVYGPEIKREIYDQSSPGGVRSGFYARVIEPGVIRAGDAISLESALV